MDIWYDVTSEHTLALSPFQLVSDCLVICLHLLGILQTVNCVLMPTEHVHYMKGQEWQIVQIKVGYTQWETWDFWFTEFSPCSERHYFPGVNCNFGGMPSYEHACTCAPDQTSMCALHTHTHTHTLRRYIGYAGTCTCQIIYCNKLPQNQWTSQTLMRIAISSACTETLTQCHVSQ